MSERSPVEIAILQNRIMAIRNDIKLLSEDYGQQADYKKQMLIDLTVICRSLEAWN